MWVWLPPTLSTAHNLLFMLIVNSCDYEFEQCECVCVCICVYMCVCTRRRLYLCLYLFILHSLQRYGGQCTEMKQKILFGKRGQSTHLKKHIIGKCSSIYQVGRLVITCTVLIVKLLANVAAVLWMMTMSSWIMLALLTVFLFVFSLSNIKTSRSTSE